MKNLKQLMSEGGHNNKMMSKIAFELNSVEEGDLCKVLFAKENLIFFLVNFLHQS